MGDFPKYSEENVVTLWTVAQGDGCILIWGHRMTVCGVSPKHTLMSLMNINDRFNCEYHPFHNAKSPPPKKEAFPVSSGR